MLGATEEDIGTALHRGYWVQLRIVHQTKMRVRGSRYVDLMLAPRPSGCTYIIGQRHAASSEGGAIID
jgi:hypothetical protein